MRSTKPDIESIFHEKLEEQLEDFPRPLTIMVSLSGGPDSSVLAYLLDQCKKEFSYSLEAAYISHGIRPERVQIEEEEQVLALGKFLGLPLHVKRFDPGFLDFFAKKKKIGLEAAARLYRYHFLEKLKLRREGHVVFALGHNRNDQVETLVMRFFGASGLEGLKGIPEKSSRLIRPLIGIDRLLIEDYASRRQLEVHRDLSNAGNTYLRNRVRNTLLDEIQRVFPAYAQGLCRLKEETSLVLEHYSRLLEEVCPWQREGGGFSCSAFAFEQLPFPGRRILCLKVLPELVSSGGRQIKRIPASFFNPLKNIRKKNYCLLKGHGMEIRRRNDRIFMEPCKGRPAERIYFHLTKDCPFYFPGGGGLFLFSELPEGFEEGRACLGLPAQWEGLVITGPKSGGYQVYCEGHWVCTAHPGERLVFRDFSGGDEKKQYLVLDKPVD